MSGGRTGTLRELGGAIVKCLSLFSTLVHRSRADCLPLLLVPLVLAVAPSPAWAQVLYGSLTGTVTDATGQAVPGADVEAVNVGTGVAKHVTTSQPGGYLFGDLLPGTYRVTVSLQGFASVVQEGVAIEANRVQRVDVTLEVADVTETVEVSGTNVTLQTDRADVNVVQTARQVNNLPLQGSMGRNYQDLMRLVPGVTLAGEINSVAGSPQRSISFNVNGVSRVQNNTKIDGASIQYPWLPTNTAYVPSAEAIEAVNIVTNAFSAEQGIAGGAAINVSIKSGTNAYAATGWWNHTNSATKARNFFLTTPDVPKDLLNQFGANVGGPILKNKLFFFGNWETTTRRQASPVRLFSLPTEALRNGDFSGVDTVTYDPASSPDPSQRTAFPNNQIPRDRIDPAAQELIARMPDPTGAGFVDNFQASGTTSFDRDNLDFKVSLNASDRSTVWGRYSLSPSDVFDPPALGEAGGDALAGGQQGASPARTQVAGFGGTYTLSPTLVFDGNVGYTRQRLGAENVDIDTNFGLDVFGIPGTNGPDRLQGGMPAFRIEDWANLGNPNPSNPFLFRDNQYVATANLSWLKGAHAFRMGWDYQNQQLNHFQPQAGGLSPRGTFDFNGNATALQGGATADRFNSWADFLLGLPMVAGKTDQLSNPSSVYMQVHALYAQDQWQMARNLTLTYGLRWEQYLWPSRDNNIGVSRFDAETGNVLIGGLGDMPKDTGADVGTGKFLPRVGVAYRASEKTVVRAGYGLSADGTSFKDFRDAFPAVLSFEHPTIQLNGVDNEFIPVTTLRDGLDVERFGQPPDISAGVIPLPTGAGTLTWPQDVEREHTHSFNVTIQHEVTPSLTAQVGYVGTRIAGQMGRINLNAAAPGAGDQGRPLAQFGIVDDIVSIQPYADAFYDSLQSQLTYRKGGSLVGVSYTWSKAINLLNDGENAGGARIQAPGEIDRNRGLASFDRTHNLQVHWVVDSPFGRDQAWLQQGLGSMLLGGWQFNGVLTAMSGATFSIVQDTAPELLAGGSGQVPDQVKSEVEIFDNNQKGVPPPGVDPAQFQYFDTSAFAPVSDARFGDVGRNTIRGPGFFNVDLGAFRTITLPSGIQMQFRAEALNVLNHPNFANPGGNVSDPDTFGFIRSTSGVGERNFRFGLRLWF
ncbi:MAG: TonB-dependent receptor plug domain-containing protein [Luteitalea sp.]|nr:TonB-dependent receptor plug domain-containing protein [Luteitalea sp.]